MQKSLSAPLSLVGIATGLVVIFGMITDQSFDGLTSVFLTTTLATSLTGFPPFFRFEAAAWLSTAARAVPVAEGEDGSGDDQEG